MNRPTGTPLPIGAEMSETEREVVIEAVNGGEFVYRAMEPAAMRYEEGGDSPTVEGRMMPYDEWTEVRSSVEGHFLERFSPGSLAKTMSEQATRIRMLWEHGMDSMLGKQTIAAIDSFREEQDGAYYRASLLDGLPPLLVSGLKRGLYGSSIRFKPIKWDRVAYPKRSEHNPDGIEERTVREGFVKELSIVTFPQYAGATAMVRSLTDEIAAKQLLGDPERLLEFLRTTDTTSTEAEPQHSEREEPEEQAPEASRSTPPVHDYLRPEEDESSWKV